MPRIIAMVLAAIISIVVGIAMAHLIVYREGLEAKVGQQVAANNLQNANAAVVLAQAEKIKAEAEVLRRQGETSEGGRTLMDLRPSEVPPHLRAPVYPVASMAVPCSAGPGTPGWDKEGASNPHPITSSFELEPGKCFFGRPEKIPTRFQGHNATLELYSPQGSLLGSCTFTQKEMQQCAQLVEESVRGKATLRFVARSGGHIHMTL